MPLRSGVSIVPTHRWYIECTVWLIAGGPPPYDARAKQAFAAALDRTLARLLRNR